MTITTPTLKRLAGFVGWAFSPVLLGGCQLAEMAQFSYANTTATHRWVDDASSTTLHFELIDDHIVLPVSVNESEPLNFVLDSGAGATVILESRHTNTLALEMGGVRLEGLSVIYLPPASVSFFDNLDEVYFDGVIGAPFFERFVVEIDYDRQLISFSEPGSVAARIDQRSADWQELTLQIQSGVPYLATRIDTGPAQSVAVKLLVDTGYRGPVSLTPRTHDEIDEPREYFSTVSQVLSGDVETKVGMSESLTIGGLQLNNVPVSYSISGGESDNGSNGLLGNEVLSRFNLVFDYPNRRMFVTPNQRFAVPIGADRSGLLIRPHRLGAVVKSIASDSAGDGGELRVDDIITSIDDMSMTRSNITELKRLLASERETVSVCWLSSDQPRCGNLALASRFDRHEP